MDKPFTGNPGGAADCLVNQAIRRKIAEERRGVDGEQMVALFETGSCRAIRRRGKSELQRAGWSVTRTVPCEVPTVSTSQGIRKVPQKTYRLDESPAPHGVQGESRGKGEKVR